MDLEMSGAAREPASLSTGIEDEAMALFPNLKGLFSKFAAGATSKDKKRPNTASLEMPQFMAVLKHLKLLPDKVSQTAAQDLFTQACAKSSSSSSRSAKSAHASKSRMDEEGFQWAMMKLLASFHDGPKTSLPVVPGAISERSGANTATSSSRSRASPSISRAG